MSTKYKENVFIQAFGKETDVKDILALAKEEFIKEGHKASEIKNINVYLKPEDETAYYVVNDSFISHAPIYA